MLRDLIKDRRGRAYMGAGTEESQLGRLAQLSK
jgi:hypothetical protein